MKDEVTLAIIASVQTIPFIFHPSSFILFLLLREGFAFFDCLFDRADHIERLLRQIIVLAFHDFTKATNRIFELHILTFQTGELRSYEEWLREEPLQLTRARNDQLVFVRQFIQTENRDDVLKILNAEARASRPVLYCSVPHRLRADPESATTKLKDRPPDK